jgi:ribosomal protein S7
MKKFNIEIELGFYERLINHILKKGKKEYTYTLAARMFFEHSKQSAKFKLERILYILAKKLHTTVECREVISRRRRFNVPFRISKYRTIYLACKWLVKTALLNKSKITTMEKLMIEIHKVVNNEKNEAQKLRYKNFKLVTSNRGNIHFRW